MTNKQILAILAALAVGFTACKNKDDDDDDGPTEEPHHATIRVAFTFMNGDNSFTLDTILHDSLGHAIKLDHARFYVSGTHAVNDEDEEVGHFEDKYLLVDASAASNDFLLGSIYTSHIHEFHFDLGLDSATNHGDFATAEAPLNIADLYANTTDGYTFFQVTGNMDSDGNGSFETPIAYNCRTDVLLTEGHAHLHHDIVEGETFTGQALVNMAGIFAGIDAVAVLSATGAEPVNARLMVNLGSSIDGAE